MIQIATKPALIGLVKKTSRKMPRRDDLDVRATRLTHDVISSATFLKVGTTNLDLDKAPLG
jgi:hypothetical protein